MQFTKYKNNINPGLYVVSTPIGNLDDITFRAINILKSSDFILCEDTRRSIKLLSHYKIKSKLISYHKFNEKEASKKIVNIIKKDKIVSLISDAGTPVISDPGQILLNECISQKINIYPIPGPSAVTSAISVAGFSDKYLFFGFLPKKQNDIEKTLKLLSSVKYSIIFFVPIKKINYLIKRFKIYFFDRKILLAREMTKIHEYFYRGNVNYLNDFPLNLKGELTIVMSEKPNEKKFKQTIDESVKIEIKEMFERYSIKDTVNFFSKNQNFSKKEIYKFCLQLKKKK